MSSFYDTKLGVFYSYITGTIIVKLKAKNNERL